MNNRGFTLIELIVVVAIIALLSLVLTPNVISLINKNKVNSYNDTIKSIEMAAASYVSDNRYSLGITCPDSATKVTKIVTLQTLVKTGALTSIPTNPCTNSDFVDTEEVRITYNCNTKEYSYYFKDKIDKCS